MQRLVNLIMKVFEEYKITTVLVYTLQLSTKMQNCQLYLFIS